MDPLQSHTTLQTDNSLQSGIAAARQGHNEEAKALLQQALQADLNCEQAWLWLSVVVDTETERQLCLDRAMVASAHNGAGNPHGQAGNSAEPNQQLSLQRLAPRQQKGKSHALRSPTNVPLPQTHTVSVIKPLPTPTRELTVRPLPSAVVPRAAEATATPTSRPTRRLPPQLVSTSAGRQTAGPQYQKPEPGKVTSGDDEPDSMAALALLGLLSVMAVSGLLVLGILWLIGWPP